jgi:N-acylneuraminate cytidylyltransferase
MPDLIALIPARGGSERVPLKNIRRLKGHPLIAYSISAALMSGIFKRVIVSTDSTDIAKIAAYYGAETPFLRPSEYATSVSPDIEWIRHALNALEEKYDCFSIVRPTSPFRSVQTIQRAWNQFLATEEADSLRAVELCKQHPGKMWTLDGNLMHPLLDQSHLEVAWHAGQYQALPKVYVQNSAMEIAWTRVVFDYNSREGKNVAPFLTTGVEGFAIDYEEDWDRVEMLVDSAQASLPEITQQSFPE